MYASRSRCEPPARSTFATTNVPSESSAPYTSPMQPPPIGRTLVIRSPSAVSTSPEIKGSAMAPALRVCREVPPSDVLQKSFRRRLDEVHDELETIKAAVVGVRDLPQRKPGGVLEN